VLTVSHIADINNNGWTVRAGYINIINSVRFKIPWPQLYTHSVIDGRGGWSGVFYSFRQYVPPLRRLVLTDVCLFVCLSFCLSVCLVCLSVSSFT